MTRHLAGWDGYSDEDVNIESMDLNGDGKVDNKDRTILTRHLAGWEGYETLPYVKGKG